MKWDGKRKVIILGCTGSIGTTALQAMDGLKDKFEIVGLSAHSAIDDLIHISRTWNCGTICLSNDNSPIAQDVGDFTIHTGREGLLDMIRTTDADIVLNGIAGSSGLEPTMVAIESGKDVALANKESIVMAGDILFDLAKAKGVSIIPVDSEHSTIHALVQAHGKEQIDRLVITASGGPFLTTPLDQLRHITVDMAIAHPTWDMGMKISIDSATLANKGLEVLEASYLFGFPADDIEVVIHPQSIVHSLVRMRNGALYAQLSPPDMALPIMSALADGRFPLEAIVKPLDFTDLTLNFRSPDFHRFPMLSLAYGAVRARGCYPIAFNGANEIAVNAFIQGKIRFDAIDRVVEQAMEADWSHRYTNLGEILAADSAARALSRTIVEGIG